MGKKHKKKNFTIPDKPIVEIEEKELTENESEEQKEVLQDEVLFECETDNTELPPEEVKEEVVEADTDSTETNETISESEPTEELEVTIDYNNSKYIEAEQEPIVKNTEPEVEVKTETEEPAAEGQSESDPFRKTEIDNDRTSKSNDSLGENKQEDSEADKEAHKPKHKVGRAKKRVKETLADDRGEHTEQEPVGEQPITGYVIRIGMRYFVSGNPGRYITTDDILKAKKFIPETLKAAELLAMSINGNVDCVHF